MNSARFAFGLLMLASSAWGVAPKNVVIIVADDVGVGDVGCFGSETIDTPNIDRLAEEGLLLRQAYTTCSVCNPTRYSIITGQYPARGPFRTPRYTNQFDRGQFPLTIDLKAPTLPRYMREQGYRTAAIGKWHLGYGRTEADYQAVMTPGPVDLGFDVHFGVPGNHNDRFERYVIGDSIYRPLSVEPGPARIDDPARVAEPVERLDDLVDTTLTGQACEFIDSSADGRFFLYLTYCATHTHITPRVDFRGRSRIGQLGDYMMELDHHVGEIVDRLEQRGVADETLILFTSDNGGQMNDVKGAGRSLTLADKSKEVTLKARDAKTVARTTYNHRTNGPLRGYKAGIHEGGFHVPCIACWPAAIQAGAETEAIFSLVDLFATVAGLVGETSGECGIDSIDQSGVLLGTAHQAPRRAVILNSPSGQLAIRSGDWKLLFKKPIKWNGDSPRLEDVPVELYDLSADPYEQTNLAKSHPKLIAQLKTELANAFAKGASAQTN